ncbi:MAG: DUF3298 domain-containing protein [Lachnospiraceae bacterium]|nr:DUF3298 domain-containing protein [Lachnospiraceae bacterium]
MKRTDNRRYLITVLAGIMAAVLVFSGCGSDDKGKTFEESSAASPAEEPLKEETEEEAPKETAEEAAPEESVEEKAEPEKESGFGMEGLSYGERFLSGEKNIFYVEDKGTVRNEYSSTDKESIVASIGGDKYYYILKLDEEGAYTLLYRTEDKGFESAEPVLKKNTTINKSAVYNEKFYYEYYDMDLDWDLIYCFDPETKEFERDYEMERLRSSIEAYKGNSLRKLDYSSFIADDLARIGRTYMLDSDNGRILGFNEKGEAVSEFDPGDPDIYSGEYYDDRYVFVEKEDSTDGSGDCSFIRYDSETGGKTVIFEGSRDETGFDIADIRDGYIYYLTEEKYEDGSVKSRSYYRALEEGFDYTKDKGELLVTIPEYCGVTSSYTGNKVNAFSVKGNYAWYLRFFDSDKEGHRGDVAWQCVNVLDPSSPGSTITFDAVEKHEAFADYGSVEKKAEARKEGDYTYFTGSTEWFTFHEDIPHSSEMNEEIKEIYGRYEDYYGHAAKMAHQDLFDSGDYDLSDENGWNPTYSYNQYFSGIKEVGSRYLNLNLSDYIYSGGAHGMSGEYNYLFDRETGKRVTMRDLYKGDEESFKEIVIKYSMEDWKNKEGNVYYEDYSPDNEAEMRQTFSDSVNIDMEMRFENDGLHILYPPYAVGPYASGFIEIKIPYGEFGITM